MLASMDLLNDSWVTDGGLETDLIFNHGVDLPEFASFPLVEATEGRTLLGRYYAEYAAIAAEADAASVAEIAAASVLPSGSRPVGLDREGNRHRQVDRAGSPYDADRFGSSGHRHGVDQVCAAFSKRSHLGSVVVRRLIRIVPSSKVAVTARTDAARNQTSAGSGGIESLPHHGDRGLIGPIQSRFVVAEDAAPIRVGSPGRGLQREARQRPPTFTALTAPTRPTSRRQSTAETGSSESSSSAPRRRPFRTLNWTRWKSWTRVTCRTSSARRDSCAQNSRLSESWAVAAAQIAGMWPHSGAWTWHDVAQP